MYFSKAFNSVSDHYITSLLKFYHIGISTNLKWIGYWSCGIQNLKFKFYASRDIIVTSEVSLGSHLGPLLFIWFNVFKSCVPCANLFVGDLTLFGEV